MENTLICLLKFSERKYLEKLLNTGEMRFSSPQTYNRVQDIVRGDNFEGAESIKNGYLKKLTVDHPTLGHYEFETCTKSVCKQIQYNDYFLSYSLYAITLNIFIDKDTHQIDKKLAESEGNDSAILITKPYKFLDQLTTELTSKRIKYESDLIKYENLQEGEHSGLTPFQKRREHNYQEEYRIIIDKQQSDYKTIKIGSIKDYCKIIDSKIATEILWEAVRKK